MPGGSGEVELDGEVGFAGGVAGVGEGFGFDALVQGLQVGRGSGGDVEDDFGVAAVADDAAGRRVDAAVGGDLGREGVVTQTVPVSHEEVRLEREPITDANRGAAMSGSDLSEEEHEVTLHAERPVVAEETVPVERVRLGTETVTEQQQVSETLRKEQIDEPDVDAGLRRDNR